MHNHSLHDRKPPSAQGANALPAICRDYPMELKIGNVTLAVVNRHNELFPYLLRCKNAVVLHIDAHPDFIDSAPVYKPEEQSMADYVDSLSIVQFICASAHRGAVCVFYHIDPREPGKHWAVGSLNSGKIVYPLSTYEADAFDGVRRCYFNQHQRRRNLSMDQILTELQGYTGHLILDTEVDAFYEHTDYILRFNRPLPVDRAAAVEALRSSIEERKRYFESQILRAPKPDLITLVRAQEVSEELFLPRSLADELQEWCIVKFSERYGDS